MLHFPNPNSRQSFLKICFPRDERCRKLWFPIIKIQSENIKMTWDINLFKLFYFCIIFTFFKCGGFTVLRMICAFFKFVVSPLQPWQFDIIYIRKNSYLNEEWLFIGRLKTGSLPRMINKEVLAQFLYKPI